MREKGKFSDSFNALNGNIEIKQQVLEKSNKFIPPNAIADWSKRPQALPKNLFSANCAISAFSKSFIWLLRLLYSGPLPTIFKVQSLLSSLLNKFIKSLYPFTLSNLPTLIIFLFFRYFFIQKIVIFFR